MLRILCAVIAVCFAHVAITQSDGSQFASFASFQLGKVTLAEVANSIVKTKLVSLKTHSQKMTLAGFQLGQTKKEFARIAKNNVRWEKKLGRVFMESKRPMSAIEIDRFPNDLKQSI